MCLHGRRQRGLGRRTPPIHRSGNGAPGAVLGLHVRAGCDEQSDDSAIAAERRIVQRGHAIPVHGGAGLRGWAPRGYPSTQPVPENKTAGSPRGSTMFWVTVNDREYSERTRSTRHLAPRSRIHPNVPNFRKSRKRRLRAKEAARNYETRQDGRGAYESRNVTSTPARTSACMPHRNCLAGA